MMKRTYVLAMAIALMTGLTACSSGSEETVAAETTTEAVTETSTEAETTTEEETTEAEREEDYVDGIVASVDETTMTVNADDGTEVTFDISNAAVNGDYPLGAGDEVSVMFYVDDSTDVQEAAEIDIYYSVAEENAAGDPVMIGVVEDATMNTIAITDEVDGQTYYFSTAIAQMVTGENGLVVGDEVRLTYLGDVGDEEYPGLAVKVVTSDMYDSEEASVNTLTGTVCAVSEGRVDLETADGNIFNFVDQGADFSMASEGDTLTIIYEGSLSEHEIPAVGLE